MHGELGGWYERRGDVARGIDGRGVSERAWVLVLQSERGERAIGVREGLRGVADEIGRGVVFNHSRRGAVGEETDRGEARRG